MRKQKITTFHTIFIANKCQKSAQGRIIYPSNDNYDKSTYDLMNKALKETNKSIEYIYVFGENIAYYEDNGYLYKIESEKEESIGAGYISLCYEEYLNLIHIHLNFTSELI